MEDVVGPYSGRFKIKVKDQRSRSGTKDGIFRSFQRPACDLF